MNNKKFQIKICRYNEEMIIYLLSDKKGVNFILQKGENPKWVFLSHVNVKEELTIEINEEIYTNLLKLDQISKYAINISKNPSQLFKRWNLIDLIGEQII
jgi:Holliday junction resolvase